MGETQESNSKRWLGALAYTVSSTKDNSFVEK